MWIRSNVHHLFTHGACTWRDSSCGDNSTRLVEVNHLGCYYFAGEMNHYTLTEWGCVFCYLYEWDVSLQTKKVVGMVISFCRY